MRAVSAVVDRRRAGWVVAVDGGDSSPFSRVFWHRVFSVAQVGSHPPPLTLTVAPPRHIRAHI
jgi:hypothetical protein